MKRYRRTAKSKPAVSATPRLCPWYSDQVQLLSKTVLPIQQDYTLATNRSLTKNGLKVDWYGNNKDPAHVATENPTSSNRAVKRKVKVKVLKTSKVEKQLHVRKIRIRPTKEQKEVFHQLFRVHRAYDNETLHLILDKSNRFKNANWIGIDQHLRNQEPLPNKHPWLTKVKYNQDLIKAAIRKRCSTWLSTMESIRGRLIKQGVKPESNRYKFPKFQMKYSSQHDNDQRFYVDCNGGKPSCGFDDQGFYFWPRTVPGMVPVFRRRELKRLKGLLPDLATKNQITIKYERPNRWFIIVSYPVVSTFVGASETVPAPQTIPTPFTAQAPAPVPRRVIALDPGVRTFMTGYTNTHQGVKYADQFASRLGQLHVKIDKLQSSQNKTGVTKPERRKIRKARLACEKTLHNRVTDMHDQLVNHLIANYDQVCIPNFATSRMVARTTDQGVKRKIRPVTARVMSGLRHYDFRMKLQRRHAGMREVTEEYTTKSCGGCYRLHEGVGGAKTFTCPHAGCLYSMDRDLHAARQILVKSSVGCLPAVVQPDVPVVSKTEPRLKRRREDLSSRRAVSSSMTAAPNGALSPGKLTPKPFTPMLGSIKRASPSLMFEKRQKFEMHEMGGN